MDPSDNAPGFILGHQHNILGPVEKTAEPLREGAGLDWIAQNAAQQCDAFGIPGASTPNERSVNHQASGSDLGWPPG